MATSFSDPQTIPLAVDPATGQPYLLDSADGRFTSQISGPAMSPTLARQYDEQLVQDTLLRNQQALIAQREAIVAEARAREAALEAQRQREIAAAQAERDRLAAQPAPAATTTPAGTEGTQAKPASPWQDPAFTGTKFASSFLGTQKQGDQTLGVQGFAALPFEERQKVVDAYVEQEVKARGMDPQRAAKFRDKAKALTYQDTGGKEPDSGLARGAGDIGLSLVQGGVNAVRSITQLFGADNTAATGLKGVNDWLQDFKSTASKQEAANIERRIEQAKKSGSTTEEIGAYLAAVKDQPAEMIAQGLGSLVTLGFGKAVQLVRGAQAASTAGKVANVTAATAQGTGAVKGQSYETTFKEAKALGKSDAEAAQLASEASEYSLANAPQQAGGAALGAASGLFGVDRLAGLGLGQATARGLAGRTTTGALGEALPEAAAAAQNTLAANQAAIRAGVMDPSREFEGVAGSAAQDAVIGGSLGGVISAVAGPRPDTGAGSTLPPAPAGQPTQPVAGADNQERGFFGRVVDTLNRPMNEVFPSLASKTSGDAQAEVTPPAPVAAQPDTMATPGAAAPAGTLSFADIEARLPPGLLDEEVATIRTALAQAQPATQAEWEAALTQTVGEPVVLRNPAPAEPTQTTTVITSTGAVPLQAAAPATPTPAATPAPIQTTPFNVDNLQAAQQQLQALQQGATPTPAAVQQAQAATANGSPDNAGAAPTGSLSNIMERTQDSMVQPAQSQTETADPRTAAVENVERLLNDIDNGTLPARPDMVAMMAQTVGVPVGASNPETLSNIRNALATIAQAQDAALTDPYSGWFDQVGTTNDADPELASLVQAADVDQQQQTAITSAQTTLATEGSVVDQQTTAETEAEILVAQQQVESTVNQILPSTLDAMPLKRFPRKQGQTKDDFLRVMKQLDSGNPLQKQAARAKLLNTANFAGNGTAALKAYDAINNTIQQMEAMGLAKTKNCG